MNASWLLSNRALRILGMIMGLVGLVDGVIELRLSAHGFAPLACVLAVYYLHHSRSKNHVLVRENDTYIYKRSALMLFGVAITELCLLEMASRSRMLSSISMIDYVVVALFAATFFAASLCTFIVINRFVRRMLSGW